MNELIKMLRKFNQERNWEQFHSPKNLVMALSVEVAEITEQFQWLTQDQSRNLASDKLDGVRDEIADIMIFLTLLADKFGIDPIEAAKEKISVNAKRYPVALAKGKADKYTNL